jgi:Protein of unknown function (DUF2891)
LQVQHTLTPEVAAQLARIALGHVTREYPHKLDHVLTGPEARAPSELHPVFYGSFDWHSCVHSYWLLARLLQRFPTAPFAAAVVALFDKQLTREKVQGECDYLAAPSARGFERPYGWGWLLKLAAELEHLAETRWSRALAPLARIFVERWREFLPLAHYPVRVGAHANTAFALRMTADYALVLKDEALLALLREAAERWYGEDRDCPAWGEPSGDDFLSPTLIEAECMHALLPLLQFHKWLDSFLPRLAERQPATLFVPATVADRSDGKTAHLDGLNLSRAWCFRSLATAFWGSDPRIRMMQRAADQHLAAALPHLTRHYMGEHWLASFALRALDG